MTRVRFVILLMTLGLVLALPAAARASDPTVTMEGMAFVPADITVPVGASVTWVNKDAAFHDAAAADGSWTSP
jgi:plastocyanin